MANNCSNSNTNSCSPCTGCEDIVSSDCVSVLSSISCINMSSGDNLTDVLNALGSAVCNFYSLIDAGNGLTVSEVDGSPSYAATNLLRFNQDSGFIVTQPSANTADVRLIPTFLFPDSNLVIVDAVTTANITLSGAQTIDTIVGVAGTTKVLVWKQTLKTENGIYIMQAGAWTRSTDSDTSAELNDQVAFANYTKTGTTYGGNYFNQIITSPTIGADNIIYQKGILGGNKLSWLVDGNETGAVKTVGSNDNFDVAFITFTNEIFRMFTTRQVGIGIDNTPLGKLHVMGTNTVILDQSILYLENYDQTHSFEYRRDGNIYRTGDLYSLTTVSNNKNTSWGQNALQNIDLGLASSNTAIGYYAMNDAVSSWACTAIGAHAGENAFGDDCCYIGKDAGKDAIGNQNTFLGSETSSNGIWDNSIALGYNAEIYGNNQLVIGAFDAPITRVYIGEGYRSSTPGSIALGGTVANGTDISGGDFSIVPGLGTGSGTPGKFLIETGIAGISSSSLQAPIVRITVDYNSTAFSPYGTLAGQTHELRFLELAAGGSNYTGFKAPDALAGNVIYTLPTADGTSGYILKTNGSGVLSWINPLSAVSLPITEVGYGTGSGITSDPKFTFDEANDLLGVQDATDYYLYADAVNHDYIFGTQSASYLFMAEETIQIQARKSGAAEIFGIKADGSGIAGAGFTQVGNLQNNTTHIYIDNTNGIHQLKLPIVGTMFSVNTNRTVVSNRLEQAKGTNAVAAGDLVLLMDGNSFTITGNTTINAITTTDWQAGSVIRLIFTGTPTVKHNTAGGANTATMKLAAGVDFVISKNPTVLTLVYDGTNWLEVSRSANAV